MLLSFLVKCVPFLSCKKNENKQKRGLVSSKVIRSDILPSAVGMLTRWTDTNKCFDIPHLDITTRLFLNGPCTASYSFIFGLFKQIIQFLQLINVKKFPFSIWRWYSNPHPLAHELSPITTTPGLPPFKKAF